MYQIECFFNIKEFRLFLQTIIFKLFSSYLCLVVDTKITEFFLVLQLTVSLNYARFQPVINIMTIKVSIDLQGEIAYTFSGRVL